MTFEIQQAVMILCLKLKKTKNRQKTNKPCKEKEIVYIFKTINYDRT